jgi:hypothetical protein
MENFGVRFFGKVYHRFGTRRAVPAGGSWGHSVPVFVAGGRNLKSNLLHELRQEAGNEKYISRGGEKGGRASSRAPADATATAGHFGSRLLPLFHLSELFHQLAAVQSSAQH